ncbi:MAG TPA: glutamate-5-semialdehyde dehydrogenase [Acidimicrobiia bacterium]|jgi:glutamate-5-semialdehyde dehydrogenase
MLDHIGRQAKESARVLARSSAAERDHALLTSADAISGERDSILAANADDVDQAVAEGISGALLDRLKLNPSRIEGMIAGLHSLAALPDPIGQVTAGFRRPNGLRFERIRAPLGVIAVIYEARPNVTSDVAGLCLKSGNAALLRGSSFALRSNLAIGGAVRRGCEAAGLPSDSVQVIEDTSREAARALMQAREYVDLLVPRGGAALIAAIEAEATVPYVIDGAGNCHIYVDVAADLEKAAEITVNAKTQRPGVCNAAEKLLVHEAVASEFLPKVVKLLADAGVEVRGDERARELAAGIATTTAEDWPREYLDLIMAIRVVGSLDQAIEHIRRFGSGHTEAIITNDLEAADRFVSEVDTAVVMVNASTRFTDGEEFGFGAEIGISTQKLHVRGPMGLEALTSERWIVRGEGHLR